VTVRRALLASVLLLYGSLSAQSPATLPFPLKLTDPVKGTVVDLAGGARLTHLVFFATWCPPCMAEMARLQELETTWSRQGYRLVLVAVATRQTPERLRSFVENESPPGRVLLDADGAVQAAAGVGDLPAHLLIGPDGTIFLRAGALADGVVPEVERRLGLRRRG
jgi:thiol-disulfide isomerase/thioredoxin